MLPRLLRSAPPTAAVRERPSYTPSLVAQAYTGTDVLESLTGAENYRSFLTGLIDEAARAASSHRLLDFGAGIGTYAREARSLGYDVLCVELDEGHRSQLEAEGFDAVATLATVPDASYEALYSLNVLEHIDDDVGALRDLHRVTAPGGRLLLYVPAFELLYSHLDRKVGHHRRYVRPQLAQRVGQAGYVVDRCEYADSLGFVATLAYRLSGLGLGSVMKPESVAFYDRWLFPLSRKVDRVCRRSFGKNLVLFAHRPA